jgi:hypothetical protein
MKPVDLKQLPGFRRRFRITPGAGQVCSAVEDDYHCMYVVLHHDGVQVTEIDAVIERAPWTTCPGAQQQLAETFTGWSLNRFNDRGEKSSNCTHLYDLALLAARHALDPQPLQYDILVSDPVDSKRYAEIWANGKVLFSWTEKDFHVLEPEVIAGTRLDKLGGWIRTLSAADQEAAKLLRWGNMMANGRIIPLQEQSDATRMPPNCYTFQPQRAEQAKRVGVIYDFSTGTQEPLEAKTVQERSLQDRKGEHPA